jgi:ribosomal protein L37AE/L43A
LSKVVGDKFYVSIEKPEKCEYCGKLDELRPYGKNGANICFKCGMKDAKTTGEMFEKLVKDVNETILVNNDFS